MKNNSKESFLKFKNNSIINKDELNAETLKSTIKDIKIISDKILEIRIKILNCSDLEQLNKIDIDSISSDLGQIVQNSILINDSNTKINIEELNQSYRSLEILYFNKKICLLNNAINKTAKESEQNLKDITDGTLFSIASVFLGISLTSSLVTGVQNMNDSYTILYYMTCLLIAIITIGIASVFMRKVDKKTIVILMIIVIVSTLWGIIAFNTLPKNDNSKSNQNDIQQENLIDQESDNKENNNDKNTNSNNNDNKNNLS